MATTTVTTTAINGHTPKPPVKTRELQNHHMNSEVWNDVKFRNDDVVIATYAKAGTTWTQQIVGQLIHAGDGSVCPNQISPWVDLRVVPKAETLALIEAQTDRRFLKTHLPLDALVYSPKAKYIFVARDGRDVIWSTHNHYAMATPLFYELINSGPDRVGPPYERVPDDPRELFVDLVEDDSRPSIPWPFWKHHRQWWDARDQPNLLLVHFNDLKRDLEGEMKRIADFLEVPEMTKEQWDAAVEHCTFAWMKEHADQSSPLQAEVVWHGGAKTFINKGTNGRWADILSEEDNKRYLKKSREEMGEEGAAWLAHGRLGQK